MLAIVAANPNGFTFNLKKGEIQRTGYAVALSDTQNSFGADGLLKVVEYAIKHDVECVGGWLDTNTGKFYFDAIMIIKDREKALAAAKANGQIALFHIDSNEEIYV